jgi:hypothetical protein
VYKNDVKIMDGYGGALGIAAAGGGAGVVCHSVDTELYEGEVAPAAAAALAEPAVSPRSRSRARAVSVCQVDGAARGAAERERDRHRWNVRCEHQETRR